MADNSSRRLPVFPARISASIGFREDDHSILPRRQLLKSVKITRNVETYSSMQQQQQHSQQPRKKPSISRLSLANRISNKGTLQQQLPDVFTPRLPGELWFQILSTAARDTNTTTGSHYSHSHSFIKSVPAHSYFPHRRARYNSWLRWKTSLTTVCSLFNLIAQEVLYEDIWITNSKDGRRLAARLGDENRPASLSRKQKQQRLNPFATDSSSLTAAGTNPGRFIRRLRVETYSTDQCSPHDILLILQHCPGLVAFEDFRSIRRPMHPLIITRNEVTPFDDNDGTDIDSHFSLNPLPPLTTDVLAQTILSRPLKRVTWTNYAHDGGNFDRGVKVFEQALWPFLEKAGNDLEVLEIITSAGGMSMSSGEQESSWLVARPSSSSNSSRNSFAPMKAESVTITTRQFSTLNLSGLSTLTANPGLSSPDDNSPSIILPALQSLRATLDNVTFSVLSTWSMPSLLNLSVVSPEFKYGLEGFKRFLEVHGERIQQLELGHSNGELEEFWITEPPRRTTATTELMTETTTRRRSNNNNKRRRSRVRLDVWCPNLKEFICSADAEWNWESPDWIAPHVLLPAHPGLEFIGVRGLEKRLVCDAEEFGRRSRGGGGGSSSRRTMLLQEEEEEYPYFMLLQQFGSMLREEAFPSLRVVRDLSWESDKIRRTGQLRIGGGGGSSSTTTRTAAATTTTSTSSSLSFLLPDRFQSRRSGKNNNNHNSSNGNGNVNRNSNTVSSNNLHIMRFWKEALAKCRTRQVDFENYLGDAVISVD